MHLMKRISQVTTWAFQWLGSSRIQARTDLHLARKVWHATMGMVIVGIYLFSGMSRITAVTILASVLGLDLFMETLRLRSPRLNQAILKVWGPFIRKCEVNRISGIPFYVGAACLAIAIFPKEIAALSILLLAWGDPIASLFGILYGDRGPRFANGKSLVGTVAGVIACLMVASVFLGAYSFTAFEYLALVAVGGLTGGTAEMLPLEVDDNFSIPMVSGFSLWLAYIVLGI
jgi:dolichol kinase